MCLLYSISFVLLYFYCSQSEENMHIITKLEIGVLCAVKANGSWYRGRLIARINPLTPQGYISQVSIKSRDLVNQLKLRLLLLKHYMFYTSRVI